MLKEKKVAVFGAHGFIGEHIAYYLKNSGFSHVNLYDVVEDSNLSDYYCVDLTDKNSFSAIDLNVDYIFMFAGLTGTYAGFGSYRRYVTVNEIGLLNLLDAIKNSHFRPKIVFPSTRLVYKGQDKPLSEGDTKECKTIYAANKICCEGLLQSYMFSFDIPYTVFRICVPYGNMLSEDYSFGTVGFFIKQAKKGIISLYGGGSFKRTFTHMKDLCFQIVEGAMKKESDGQIYNIGGETHTLYHAAEIIADKFGAKIVSVPFPERDLRIESGHTFFDDTKIQALLGGITYRRLEDFSKDI